MPERREDRVEIVEHGPIGQARISALSELPIDIAAHSKIRRKHDVRARFTKRAAEPGRSERVPGIECIDRGSTRAVHHSADAEVSVNSALCVRKRGAQTQSKHQGNERTNEFQSNNLLQLLSGVAALFCLHEAILMSVLATSHGRQRFYM